MSYDFAADGIVVSGHGEVKSTCPQCSHTRKKATQKCLNVNTETGVWHCWHCDWSGKAVEVGAVRHRADRPRAYTKPSFRPSGLNAPGLEWLQSRGITAEVASRNGITTTAVFMPQVGSEVTALAFPYRRGGEVINVKYRDKAKNFRLESGAERLLYGMDDIEATTIIVEGELDKLACEVAGFKNCVSVPDGAPPANAKNLESKFDFLDDPRVEAVENWIIAVDNDAPGLRLQQELVRRFGSDRCKIANWPDGDKDANDVLRHSGPVTLRECIEAATPVPIVGAFDAMSFIDDFSSMYDEGVPDGFSTGWGCVDDNWRIQPGQLTVVTGIPGHGKSEWVDALCVNLAISHGWRTAFYSPENQPVKLHMMKLAEKFIGKPFNDGPNERMTPAEVSTSADWMQSHFHWILPDKPSLDEIMERARLLVLRFGVRCIVVDPWNEVEHNRPFGMTEVEYLSQSLMRLRMFARKHEVLMIVVAHPKNLEKGGDGTYPVPTPYDISGGAMWRNKADNCLSIYANQSDKSGKVELHVQKVKFKLFGHIGLVPLRWDRVTGRYFSR